MQTVREMLTPSQAARALGLSTQMVRLLTREGKLPCKWTPLGRLLDADVVERLAAERRAKKAGSNQAA